MRKFAIMLLFAILAMATSNGCGGSSLTAPSEVVSAPKLPTISLKILSATPQGVTYECSGTVGVPWDWHVKFIGPPPSAEEYPAPGRQPMVLESFGCGTASVFPLPGKVVEKINFHGETPDPYGGPKIVYDLTVPLK